MTAKAVKYESTDEWTAERPVTNRSKPEPMFNLPCVVRYYDDGIRTGIFFKRGKDFVRVIGMNGAGDRNSIGGAKTIRINKWLRAREREFKAYDYPAAKDGVYPIKKAAKHFLSAGTRLGITGAAQQILQAIVTGKPAPDEGPIKQAENEVMATQEVVSIDANLKQYKKVKAASGRKSLDSGDAVAKQLRGKELEDVYKIAAKHLDESVASLKKKYAHLNTGMQRMNLGNRMRKKEDKK